MGNVKGILHVRAVNVIMWMKSIVHYPIYARQYWKISRPIHFYSTGLPVRPMYFVERIFVPIEEQYKYVSDQDDDTEDEEWTLGPKKKKKCKETIAVSTGK